MDINTVILTASSALWSFSSFFIYRAIVRLDEVTDAVDKIATTLAVLSERVDRISHIEEEIKLSRERYHSLANVVNQHELKIEILSTDCKRSK